MMQFKRSFRTVSMMLLVFFAWCIAGAWASDTTKTRWIVVYKSQALKTKAVQHKTVKPRHSYKIIPGIAGDFTAIEIEQIKHDPSVAFVEPDAIRHAIRTNPALKKNSFYAVYSISQQIAPYGIDLVHARDVWPFSMGTGVRVADLDTGIDLTHPNLPNIIASTTFTNAPVQDSDGHGTHTAGTIAGPGNAEGVLGVAPEAGLLVAQVFDRQGNAYDSDLIAAIDWAIDNQADVINMSLGGPVFDAALAQACASAVAGGAVVVAAAGNDGTNAPSYPAAYPSVISVAAVDQAKQRASFSNYGSTIDLSAPGVAVLSNVPVETGWLTSANWSGLEHQTTTMDGSANGTLSANAVYCGLGNPGDFPVGVTGNIAHIRRGVITFQEKVNNAVAAGASGVIISNNDSESLYGTLSQTVTVPVVIVSQANGDDLQANNGIPATITSQFPADYAPYDGTSMAAPHVTGVAALLVGARHGQITPTQVRNAMETSAQDLGASGLDDYYGYGLVDAKAALGKVIPIIQSVSATPTSVSPGQIVTVTAHLSIATGVTSLTANGIPLSGSGSTRTGNVPADAMPGPHTIDVTLTDNWDNISHDTSQTYTTNSPPAVSGTITLSDWSGIVTGLSATIQLRNGSGVTVETKNVTLNTSGGYLFTTSLDGSYTAVAKASHWLAKAMPVTISGGSGSADLTLRNGDCNGDNGVDEIDYALLSNAWYQGLGDIAYNANADLNGDGSVDEVDYAILSNAWYTAGD